MIKLRKLQKPQVLEDNAEEWTQEYCSCLYSGGKPSRQMLSRYKDNEIKSLLIKETHGKCAYCESKLSHITYGDVEHIFPKNKNARPDLYVEWSNLTLSCEQCNRSGKRDYYNENLPLINPYVDDPEQHFRDLGPLIMHRLGDDRAFVTKNILDLNRASLVERRTERIKLVEFLLISWAQEQDPNKKRVLELELNHEYSEDKEYSSTIKSYLRANGFPVENKL